MNRIQYELLVNMLGIPATVTHIKTGAVTNVKKVGVANARKVGDVQLVNDYGINARIVTVLAKDIGFELEKFDKVEFVSERLVLDAVIPVHEPSTGDVIGYRGIVRGK